MVGLSCGTIVCCLIFCRYCCMKSTKWCILVLPTINVLVSSIFTAGGAAVKVLKACVVGLCRSSFGHVLWWRVCGWVHGLGGKLLIVSYLPPLEKWDSMAFVSTEHGTMYTHTLHVSVPLSEKRLKGTTLEAVPVVWSNQLDYFRFSLWNTEVQKSAFGPRFQPILPWSYCSSWKLNR